MIKIKRVLRGIENPTEYNMIKSIETDEEKLVLDAPAGVLLPFSVKSDTLKTVIIKGSWKVFTYAFSLCPNIKEVFLSLSKYDIERAAFKGCQKIESIELDLKHKAKNSSFSFSNNRYYDTKGEFAYLHNNKLVVLRESFFIKLLPTDNIEELFVFAKTIPDDSFNVFFNSSFKKMYLSSHGEDASNITNILKSPIEMKSLFISGSLPYTGWTRKVSNVENIYIQNPIGSGFLFGIIEHSKRVKKIYLSFLKLYSFYGKDYNIKENIDIYYGEAEGIEILNTFIERNPKVSAHPIPKEEINAIFENEARAIQIE